jgi:hypothetical protein
LINSKAGTRSTWIRKTIHDPELIFYEKPSTEREGFFYFCNKYYFCMFINKKIKIADPIIWRKK